MRNDIGPRAMEQILEKEPSKRALAEFFRGKAHYQSKRYDRAEVAWTELG